MSDVAFLAFDGHCAQCEAFAKKVSSTEDQNRQSEPFPPLHAKARHAGHDSEHDGSRNDVPNDLDANAQGVQESH